MTAELPRVLLAAGIDSIAVSRLPALFQAANFEVHVLAPRRLAIMRSRFIARRIEAEPPQLKQFLETIGDSFDRVVLADEPSLLEALGGADLEWMRGWSPVPLTQESVARLLSKTQFLLDCAAAGIPTPKFEVCRDAGAVIKAAGDIGYPIYVKGARGLAGSGLRYAVSEADLKPQLSAFDFREPVVVQGELKGVTGAVSMLYRHGAPVCWFAYLMRQTWPNRFSSACSIEIFDHAAIPPLVEHVGKITAFDGLCGLDFVWDPATNAVTFLEFNPRPGPAYYLAPAAGISFPLGLERWRNGGDPQYPGRSDARLIHMFPQALYDAIDHARPRQFLETLADAPWGDPGLTAAHFRRLATHYVPLGRLHRR